MEAHKNLNAQSNLNQKEQFLEASENLISNYTTDLQQQNRLVLAQNRHVQQKNNVEDPKIKPYTYKPLIVNTGV